MKDTSEFVELYFSSNIITYSENCEVGCCLLNFIEDKKNFRRRIFNKHSLTKI